ncbi:cyclic 2,3-diphosphoglycerate synthase [Desulfurococcus amylolyticus]|uniref:cyclic 2,3-diphosphoglycerate synthase n=1 Tax=Desulfurococcus amylolyticus TaxID=94694 RepID=UPI0023F277DF|nr:cyclic 2,3-diphosphoglycerate synthase [Desulfurococcus amylolyticus]
MARKVVILGASGRDFHNFNVFYRDNPNYRVIAFLQTQIPGISGRRYPPSLAGSLYPDGIPVLSMDYLEEIVKTYGVEEAVLAYSDLTYSELGSVLSRVTSLGLTFKILGPMDTMLESIKPLIAVTGVKTGAGKSMVSREVALELKRRGLRVGVVRHPMPYGDLEKSVVQSFHSFEDLDRYNATIEEREEYEHYLRLGFSVYAGVDYGRILRVLESENDIILWDGGNNDWPFYKPDFMITVADAMRPGIEVSSFPGEVNLRMCDAVIINKVDQARPGAVEKIKENIKSRNPSAYVSLGESVVTVDNPKLIEGRRVLVIEDSPTVTHGGAPYAAGYVAALKHGAQPVDPRPFATGFFQKIYEEYPHMGPVLPSTGYRPEQLKELEETIRRAPVDAVVLGTPSDITRLIKLDKPVVRVEFKLKIVEGPTIKEYVDMFMEKARKKVL